MTRPLRVGFVTADGASRASSRVRVLQYLPLLDALGVEARTVAWGTSAGRASRVRRVPDMLRLARWADVVVLQKPFQPVPVLRAVAAAARAVVVDVDDAVWEPAGQSRDPAALAAARLERLRVAVRSSQVTIAGSAWLAQRVGELVPGAATAVVPSSIDLARYDRVRTHVDRRPARVGWIGSPVNLADLDVAADALASLSPDLARVVVISSRAPALDGVDVAFVPWAPDTELDALCDLDIGIMPLRDDERSRGRCGYKALQYLACGVPVVASPVGGSAEILGAVLCGSYAADDAAWGRALTDLAGDPARRAAAGAAGRAHVEAHYSIQANVDALVALLDAAAGRRV